MDEGDASRFDWNTLQDYRMIALTPENLTQSL